MFRKENNIQNKVPFSKNSILNISATNYNGKKTQNTICSSDTSYWMLFTNIKNIYLILDVDECKAITIPCLHGGTCYNTLGSYNCQCKKGYQGPICADGKL